jgi:hypothetical protein
LNRVLEGITAYCRAPRADWESKGWISHWQSCTGTAVALYFFATDAEDRRIVQYMEQLEPKVLFNMLVESHGYAEAWVGNRPDRTRWISLIDARPVLDRDPDGRAGYKRLFQTATPGEARVVLIDPRYQLTPAQTKQLERAVR